MVGRDFLILYHQIVKLTTQEGKSVGHTLPLVTESLPQDSCAYIVFHSFLIVEA